MHVRYDFKSAQLLTRNNFKKNIILATWVSFFSNAGIPSPTNASYAHIFVKNKIAMDMLTELNKEYLREVL